VRLQLVDARHVGWQTEKMERDKESEIFFMEMQGVSATYECVESVAVL
jgi:hypothetical protein